ncbi:MAG: hypothetical protein ACKO96_06620, partial [Flammeovirgaceae bacterium]
CLVAKMTGLYPAKSTRPSNLTNSRSTVSSPSNLTQTVSIKVYTTAKPLTIDFHFLGFKTFID